MHKAYTEIEEYFKTHPKEASALVKEAYMRRDEFLFAYRAYVILMRRRKRTGQEM